MPVERTERRRIERFMATITNESQLEELRARVFSRDPAGAFWLSAMFIAETRGHHRLDHMTDFAKQLLVNEATERANADG